MPAKSSARQSSTTLIHITPQLPPNICGVGDYAVHLGRRIAQKSRGSVRSAYLSAGHTPGHPVDNAIECIDLTQDAGVSALLSGIDHFAAHTASAAILLHYVGYGYNKRGCPYWLLRALKTVRRQHSHALILTMFHELYAHSARPWESAFWTSPLQRYMATKLARLSNAILTNRRSSAQWLNQRTTGKAISMSPTFSCIGEPEQLPSFENREPYAVVFGGAAAKTTLYRKHSGTIRRVLKLANIEKLIDIGAPTADDWNTEVDLPLESLGILPARVISDRLRKAKLGFIRIPLHCDTKSSILAAYLAHGVPTFVDSSGEGATALKPNREFIRLDSLTNLLNQTDVQLAEISKTAREWYLLHAHSKHAARLLLRHLLPHASGTHVA